MSFSACDVSPMVSHLRISPRLGGGRRLEVLRLLKTMHTGCRCCASLRSGEIMAVSTRVPTARPMVFHHWMVGPRLVDSPVIDERK
jgi:hypothetical protein